MKLGGGGGGGGVFIVILIDTINSCVVVYFNVMRWCFLLVGKRKDLATLKYIHSHHLFPPKSPIKIACNALPLSWKEKTGYFLENLL